MPRKRVCRGIGDRLQFVARGRVSSRGFDSKAPEDEHRSGEYCDADKLEPKRHNAFLPWLSTMASSGDWRKGRRTKRGGECCYEPVPIRAGKRGPVCDNLWPR